MLEEYNYFKEKFVEVKNELMAVKDRDTEIKLEAKVNDLQRELQGRLIL